MKLFSSTASLLRVFPLCRVLPFFRQSLVFLTVLYFSQINALDIVKDRITKANLLSRSTSPILIVTTRLTCPYGFSYAGSVENTLERSNLQGIRIAWADINEIYTDKIFNMAPIEAGDILLVKNGKILDTSKDADPDRSYLAHDDIKFWTYKSLKKNGIKFSMVNPEPGFLEPVKDSSPSDLDKGFEAYFPLTSDKKAALGKATFIASKTDGTDGFVNQAFYMNGLYTANSDMGDANAASSLPEEGHSFSVSVKLEERKDDEKYLLFSAGSRNLRFQRNKKTGKLEIESVVWIPGKDGKDIPVVGMYRYPDVSVELNKWHNFTVSLDLKKQTASISMDGKRLKDLNLGSNFAEGYKKRYYKERILSLNPGDGSVLKGYVRNITYYSRPLNSTEMIDVQKKFAVNASDSIAEVNSAPNTAETEKQNTLLLKAARSGSSADAASALKNGADVNVKYNGWTPLLFAAYYGHEEVVKELIRNQANPLAEISGWNALRFAKKNNYDSIADLLENHSNTERFFKERKMIVKNSRAEILPPDLK